MGRRKIEEGVEGERGMGRRHPLGRTRVDRPGSCPVPAGARGRKLPAPHL